MLQIDAGLWINAGDIIEIRGVTRWWFHESNELIRAPQARYLKNEGEGSVRGPFKCTKIITRQKYIYVVPVNPHDFMKHLDECGLTGPVVPIYKELFHVLE